MKKNAWILIVLQFALVSLANADSVVVQGGFQQTPNSNYGNGGEFVARYEKPVYGDFSGGIEYAYHGPTHHYGYGSFEGHSLLAEAIYYPPVEWKAKPYLLGGLGWSWWSFNPDQSLKDAQIDVKLGDNISEKVGVGLDYPIDAHWSLNAEYSFFQCNVPKRSFYSYSSAEANVVGGSKVGQGENLFLVGVRYSW